MAKQHIVKRGGHKERFDERKVYASCYSACLACRIPKKDTEKICEYAAREIKKWIRSKREVTSTEIFKEVVHILKKKHNDVAFMYETHRDLS